ncbi:hypothetical protein KF913_08635 [Candidatus Obscuribacterales bacterium]|jgi:Fe-S-cluster containining protein|nr:hypothetical protein [Candidatus Obscuribacterales bacterium]
MNWLSSLKKLAEGKDDPGFVRIPEDKDESISAGESPTKQQVIDSTCHYTCTRMCYGYKDKSSQCCCIGDRDFIIGPISDTERFLAALSEKLGEEIKYEDVFIDYEEGRKIFPDKSCWQNPDNFPCMRIVPDQGRGYPCQFLSLDGKCSVHSIKPETCRIYLCDYLKNIVNFLDQTL